MIGGGKRKLFGPQLVPGTTLPVGWHGCRRGVILGRRLGYGKSGLSGV